MKLRWAATVVTFFRTHEVAIGGNLAAPPADRSTTKHRVLVFARVRAKAWPSGPDSEARHASRAVAVLLARDVAGPGRSQDATEILVSRRITAWPCHHEARPECEQSPACVAKIARSQDAQTYVVANDACSFQSTLTDIRI